MKTKSFKMNRLFVLAVALMTISVNAWGTTYTKVTTVPADWSGEYLLVYETPAVAPATAVTAGVAWTGVDAGQCRVDVTISNGTITTKPDGAVTLTIASMTGGYSIKVNGGDKNGKYINKTTYANGLEFLDNASANTLSVSDGTAVITGSGVEDAKYVTMRYNSASGTSNERFRYYKSGQQAIALYKKQADCTETLGTPSVTATPGNASATLTWNNVANGDTYTVTCAGATIGTVTGTTTKTCQLTGLTNGTPYTWKVKANAHGIYCESSEASGTVTPSANCTVTWKVDGETYTTGSPTTSVAPGGKVSTLPTAPSTPASCGDAVFMGWTDHEVTNGSVPSPLFKTAGDAPVVNADVTYHAVFADEE